MDIQSLFNLNQFVHDGCLLLLFFVLILISKKVNDFLSPYSVDDELTQKDNVALATSISGYFGAITIIFIGAMIGPDSEELNSSVIISDLVSTGSYVILGIVLLNFSRIINDKLILRKFSNTKEIIEDRNAGTGAVQFGSYIASGLIIAGSVHGEGGGIVSVLAFFILGQVALIVFTYIYNLMVSFDLHTEIEKDNVAAGVAFGGTLVALGIVLVKATSGDFYSWQYNITHFLQTALLILLLLPINRFLFDKLIIPKSSLNHEIKNDKNLGAAFLEVTLAMSVAAILNYIIA